MNSGFAGLPPIVKNIIILNVVMLLLTAALKAMWGTDLNSILGLYYPESDYFRSWQIVTHMFMHGGFIHLFFNMFALFMFGGVLERVWGPQRFLIYYLITGLGAAFTHEAVMWLQYTRAMDSLSPEQLQRIYDEGLEVLRSGQAYTNNAAQTLSTILNVPTVGASGAVFGVLLAFGVLFPNTQLMLIFPPIPIKAKYFVLGYGAIELYLAVTSPGSNIAHAAHLGGMIFGYMLIRYWRKTTKTLY
ncbi:MAG: rhomboid family intramembrane serine protease [Bacteroidales bacterium]|jgi:membrane associated rhomboid family serine protease|nr:rhomboid family intramembrane serine protease [Bacteroidales bacterium]